MTPNEWIHAQARKHMINPAHDPSEEIRARVMRSTVIVPAPPMSPMNQAIRLAAGCEPIGD